MSARLIPVLALGGPLHGQPIQVGPSRVAYAVADLDPVLAQFSDDDDEPVTRTVTYRVRDLAIFGRHVLVAVQDGLPEDRVNDLAWDLLGSAVVHAIHQKQLEQEN
jgi:hypothetical protein